MNDVTFEASTQPAHGAVLLIHGLNNSPRAMDPLASALAARGFEVSRIALDGHHGPPERLHDVTAEAWLENVRTGLERLHSRHPREKVHVVGFSLGGVLPLVLAKRAGEPPYARAVLLAPAIVMTRISDPLRALSRLTRGSVILPSFAPRDLRARPFTSLAAYRALFQLSDELTRSGGLSAGFDAPTLALISERDGLVSARGLRRWAAGIASTRWSVEEIEAPGRGGFRHAIFHPSAFSPEGWESLVDRIAAHLSGRDRPISPQERE